MSVNLNIVPSGFPICTEGALTRPTMRMDILPEVHIPQFHGNPCPCIPTATAVLNAQPTLRRPGGTLLRTFRLSGRLRQQTVDCCKPGLKMTFHLDMPCLPLSMQVSGGVKRRRISNSCAVHKPSPSYRPPPINVSVRADMRTGCVMNLRLNGAIPCLPFDMRPTLGVRNFPTGQIKARAHVNMRPVSCGMTLRMNIDLPPITCPGMVVGQALVVFKGSASIGSFLTGNRQRVTAVTKTTLVTLQRQTCYRVETTVPTVCTRWVPVTVVSGVTAFSTQMTTGIIGHRMTCEFVQAIVPRTYLALSSPGVVAYSILGQLNARLRTHPGLHGTCHKVMHFSLALPIMPCAKITMASGRHVTVVTALTRPTMLMTQAPSRGALMTCRPALNPLVRLPALSLPSTTGIWSFVDGAGNNPSVYAEWSRNSEFNRKLVVRVRMKGGLGTSAVPDTLDVVVGLSIAGGQLVAEKKQLQIEHGRIVSATDLAPEPIVNIGTC